MSGIRSTPTVRKNGRRQPLLTDHRPGFPGAKPSPRALRSKQMETAMTMTGKPLIESDRVEGTTVYDPQGNNIGSIKRLMIEKISGQVAYVVMSFGGFLAMGAEEHAIPWNKLTYDTNLGGYRTDITEPELRAAPTFSRDPNWDWSDRGREQELHDYYRARYYWD